MIKELDLQELQEIYATRMRDDFPPEEIKPFSSIAAMYSRGEYKGLAMKNGEATLAYAFLVICRIPEPAVLLDYFAVNRETRGQGIGSAMLSALGETFAGTPFLLESENPDDAHDSEDRQKRRRRIAFYQKNHALDTGVRSQVYGVEYVILQLLPPDQSPNASSARRSLTAIYKTMFRPEQLAAKVKIHPDPGS